MAAAAAPALMRSPGYVLQKQKQFYSLKKLFNSAAAGHRSSLARALVAVGVSYSIAICPCWAEGLLGCPMWGPSPECS